jgi:4-hydroxy-tetrahydrodipicolinate synthase
MLEMTTAYLKGEVAKAMQWHHKLFPLCRDMLGLSTNPIPIKAAMKLLGRDTGELRLPMTPLDGPSEARLRKTLTNYGLL